MSIGLWSLSLTKKISGNRISTGLPSVMTYSVLNMDPIVTIDPIRGRNLPHISVRVDLGHNTAFSDPRPCLFPNVTPLDRDSLL